MIHFRAYFTVASYKIKLYDYSIKVKIPTLDSLFLSSFCWWTVYYTYCLQVLSREMCFYINLSNVKIEYESYCNQFIAAY